MFYVHMQFYMDGDDFANQIFRSNTKLNPTQTCTSKKMRIIFQDPTSQFEKTVPDQRKRVHNR